MYSVLLYRIKHPHEQYDVPSLHDTFYAEQFSHIINTFEIINNYTDAPSMLVKHAVHGYMQLQPESVAEYDWYLYTTENYTQYKAFIKHKQVQEGLYIYSDMGVYTILVEPKPTMQVKRADPDADMMEVDVQHKRSRFAEQMFMLLLQ